MRKVVVYVDGFNFYFGLRESGWKRYYWLDYPKLAQKLAKKLKDEEETELVATKYFTSHISSPEDKRKRQSNYLEALEIQGNINIYYGNYREITYTCSGCKRPNFVHNEKQTDVNIAVQMLTDAYQENFDTAVLIGGDSDLVPPIREIRRLFPQKRVISVFPPKRVSKEIKAVCNGFLHIGEADLKNNLLPDKITKADGYVLECPKSWR